jgi:hypothetical protein
MPKNFRVAKHERSLLVNIMFMLKYNYGLIKSEKILKLYSLAFLISGSVFGRLAAG